jgi:hypothetical protein
MKQLLPVIYKAPTPTESSNGYGAECISYFTKIGAINYIGYVTDEEFTEKVEEFAAALEKDNTNFWTAWSSLNLSTIIQEAVAKAYKSLPITEENIHFFIFPWSAERDSVADFGGVTAVAPHASVVHLFIDPTYPDIFRATQQTVVHEYTHLYYYQTTGRDTYTLYEHMLMEGIAEVFREEIVGGNPAPWSTALDKKTALDSFEQLKKHLTSTDETIHANVLFGGAGYLRWTGYSVGYHLVQQERKRDSAEDWVHFIKRLRTERPELH